MLPARFTCPQSVSDMTKAAFLSNFRSPAGVVSTGRPMRTGRAGASGSKKADIWNAALGSLTRGCVRPGQLGRSSTQRIANHGFAAGFALACAMRRTGIFCFTGSAGSAATT